MSTQTAQRRQGRHALAVSIAGLVTALLWLLVTILETDSGWEDAIWRHSSSSKTAAWITTLLAPPPRLARWFWRAAFKRHRVAQPGAGSPSASQAN